MKLLLLLSLFVLASANEAYVPAKVTESNDVSQQVSTDLQTEPNNPEAAEDKKVAKRSYGWNPWGYVGYGGYGIGWPWYGPGYFGGYGWYPGWPFYGGHGYIGYRGWLGHGGGWYKGW